MDGSDKRISMNYLNTACASHKFRVLLAALFTGLMAGCAAQQDVSVPEAASEPNQKSSASAVGVKVKNADNSINFNPHPETKVDSFSNADDSVITD